MFTCGNNPLGGGGEKASLCRFQLSTIKMKKDMQQIYRQHERHWESQSVGNIRSISVNRSAQEQLGR